jgi:type II secretory ATPase GspE/PulE/Tfp pilus assembly ATPase PilB-like protein
MEDPIELPLPRGHVQVSLRGVDETDRKAGFQVFARSSMRADPDVFFMGEIRDTVSAELAVQAATTGHPVFGTVHANDAFAVPNRLQNLGMDLRQVLDDGLLRGMIAQRLVPRLCPHCRLSTTEALAASEGDKERQIAIRHFATLFAKPHQVTAEDGTRSTSTQHDLHFRNLKGCSQCDRKGVKGRMVVAEVVELDATLLHLFREARGFVAKELWQQRGNLTLRDVAARRVREGQLCPIETANIVEGFDDQKEIIDFKAIEKAERAAASRGRA